MKNENVLFTMFAFHAGAQYFTDALSRSADVDIEFSRLFDFVLCVGDPYIDAQARENDGATTFDGMKSCNMIWMYSLGCGGMRAFSCEARPLLEISVASAEQRFVHKTSGAPARRTRLLQPTRGACFIPDCRTPRYAEYSYRWNIYEEGAKYLKPYVYSSGELPLGLSVRRCGNV
jgi:hypothetical protein